MRLLRLAALVVLAAALYGAADLVFSWNPIAAAPYHAHRGHPVFRSPPALVLGAAGELVNGCIAILLFAWVFSRLPGPAWRQGLALGGAMWGLWVVSGTMSAYVWLDVPPELAAANVAFGLPKSLAIGVGIGWLWGKVGGGPPAALR